MTLIDKAKLLNTIATEVHYDSEHSLEMYAKMLSLINDAPEAVRHGRWQRERNPMRYQVVPYVFVCNQCGTAFEYDTPYCGECGAKMDEVEDG